MELTKEQKMKNEYNRILNLIKNSWLYDKLTITYDDDISNLRKELKKYFEYYD